jgi:hypothetical protein
MQKKKATNEGGDHWTSAKPATKTAIQQLVKGAGVELPKDYLEFLGKSDGGEGELGVKPGWIRLWPAKEVMAANQDYCVAEFLPGFFAFGSSGSDEMFAFDVRQPKKVSVASVPFVPMEAEEAVQVSRSFSELAKQFGKSADKHRSKNPKVQ